MKDKIVEQVRKNRKKYTEQFNDDIHAICQDLKKKEEQYNQKYGYRIESLSSKDTP